jgi:hypothetical protein
MPPLHPRTEILEPLDTAEDGAAEDDAAEDDTAETYKEFGPSVAQTQTKILMPPPQKPTTPPTLPRTSILMTAPRIKTA